MIDLVDITKKVDVPLAEFKRLLGYPRGRRLSPGARRLAHWARAWYARHGRPWVFVRPAESLEITTDGITIEGARFTSERLRRMLRNADAHGAFLVAVGAGPEVEREAQRLWHDEKPDEYFFMEMFGSAVVEHLTTMTGARLCAWAEEHGMAVLPHYSPGYPEWDIAEQGQLLQLMRRSGKRGVGSKEEAAGTILAPCSRLPANLEVFASGMLRPKKSLLAVFGMTRRMDLVGRLTDLTPCTSCSYLSCQYRRAAYHPAPEYSALTTFNSFAAAQGARSPEANGAFAGLDRAANYSVNVKALSRWVDERLTLARRDDGTTDATFRYDGTTCSNMGQPLAFHYYVKLGRADEGYPLCEQQCQPAPNDQGHTCMCEYLTNADGLMTAIDKEQPLFGRPLGEALVADWPTCAAGCYCEADSRTHKWGLVLQTIHYALARQELNEA
jgi:hypothetical protein